MSDSWDDYAKDWDNNPDVILYAQRAFESLQKTIELSGLRVLDFGCGSGQLTQRLAEHAKEVIALDPAKKMIEVLDKKQLHQVTTLAIELNENSIQEYIQLQGGFDLVVASSVCTFLEDYPATLKLITGLLGEHGRFVQWDWHSDQNSDSGFSQNYVSHALKQAGFNTVSTSLPFSLTSSKGNMEVLMAEASF